MRITINSSNLICDREGYGALVYIDQSTIKAVDSNKKVIIKGRAGEDDSTVIQAAIDSGIKNLALSPGTFYISSPLIPRAELTIEGRGRGTILKTSKNADCDIFSWTENLPRLQIKDLSLDGNKGNNNAGNGISGPCYFSMFNNLFIQEFPEDGINISKPGEGSTVDNIFRDIWTRKNGGNGFSLGVTGGDGHCSDNYLTNIISSYNGENGFNLSGGGHQGQNINSYGNTGDGIHTTASYLKLINPVADGNGRHGVHIIDSWAQHMTTLYARHNSQAQPGEYDGIYLEGRNPYSFFLNLFGGYIIDSQTEKTQRYAINGNNMSEASRIVLVGGKFTPNLTGFSPLDEDLFNISGSLL